MIIPQSPQNLPDKEVGKECIAGREKDCKVLSDLAVVMTTELNTRPLVLIPVSVADHDRFLLAFLIKKGEYSPVAIVEPTDVLQALIDKVMIAEPYKLLSHEAANIPGFTEYSKGVLWNPPENEKPPLEMNLEDFMNGPE